MSEELLLSTAFYEKELIEEACRDFAKSANITVIPEKHHLRIMFTEAKPNTHLEFANYLLKIRRRT